MLKWREGFVFVNISKELNEKELLRIISYAKKIKLTESRVYGGGRIYIYKYRGLKRKIKKIKGGDRN